MRKNRTLLVLLALALLAAPALAGRADVSANLITFDSAKAQLRITGPGGYLLERNVDGAYSFSLADKKGGILADGVYSWELRPTAAAAKRGQSAPAALDATSGSFTVRNGAFVVPTTGGRYDVPTKDQVIADDLIVQMSLCVGFDCVNGESFGFDTIRLKENNTRIKFEDTSTGTFPSTDWQLTANDSASGGANRFSIEDITAARVPVTIEGGTTTNSLYLDSTGRIGFRTSTPVLDLHINTSNTPGIRLEQNSSGGFSAYSWDIAGNETSFFIRDVTAGSRLPFRIFPGAASGSLIIDDTSDIGIGTLSPAGALHINRSTGAALDAVHLTNTGGMFMTFENTTTNDDWFFTAENANNGSFIIDSAVEGAADGPEFTLTTAGNLTLAGTLTITGGCTGCDAVLTPEWPLESIEAHAASMFQNSYLPAVGPTPEGTTSIDVFQKTTGMLQELEKAHIYISQLNTALQQKDARMTELQARLAQLEALVAGMAAQK